MSLLNDGYINTTIVITEIIISKNNNKEYLTIASIPLLAPNIAAKNKDIRIIISFISSDRYILQKLNNRNMNNIQK